VRIFNGTISPRSNWRERRMNQLLSLGWQMISGVLHSKP
jgi:hypothetical protein